MVAGDPLGGPRRLPHAAGVVPPASYMAALHTYAWILSALTVLVLVRAAFSPHKTLHLYAALAAGAAALAVVLRAAHYPMIIGQRIVDLLAAQLTHGACVLLLHHTLTLCEADRQPGPVRAAAVRQYWVWSHVAWLATALASRVRWLHTTMYLALCVQWTVLGACVSGLGAMPALARGAARSSTARDVRALQMALSCSTWMCLQLLFLVVHTYTEEVRDFHVWIVVTSRTFAGLFFGAWAMPTAAWRLVLAWT